jgi:histone H3/H4
MTFDETPRCQRGENLVCDDCECIFEMFAHGPHKGRCTVKHAIAQSTEDRGSKGAVRGFHCRRCMMVGCVDEPDNWIDSYVRTKLRAMAADVFSVSRHTAELTAQALQDYFLSEMDAVLTRILDLAALRYLRDGSSTITQEDVKLALRLVTYDGRRPM